MKRKFIFFAEIAAFTIAMTSIVQADDAGMRLILTKSKVVCGTDLDSKTYAYKDEEDEQWKGIDVDFCKILSLGIFGRADRFEMVNVNADEIQNALNTDKIDVMLGGAPFSASIEAGKKYAPAALLYYDKQMFLTKNIEEATSMKDYDGQRICVVNGSEDLDNINDFKRRYNLDFKPLTLASNLRAKEAFLLKRCEIMSGNEIYLKGIVKNNFTDSNNLAIIPETIEIKPNYAYTAYDNKTLQVVVKWIINALILAEQKDINSKNIDIFIGNDETSIKNLLGIDPKLWEKFNLNPNWVKTAIREFGNYGEIIERNFGEESELKIPREENKLIRDGGLMKAQPFI